MAARSRAQQEDLFFRGLLIELGEAASSVLVLGATVKSQVLDSSVLKEDLQDVHQLGKL